MKLSKATDKNDSQAKGSQVKKVDVAQVEILVHHFLDVMEGLLNTIDDIAKVNTEVVNGAKVIEAARFRLNIRKLKVRLMQDLKKDMKIKEGE